MLIFLDTNVLRHLLSADETNASRAEEIIAGGGIIGVQVLNEFASVAIRKLGLWLREAKEILGVVRAACEVVPVTIETHNLAMEIAERHGFHIYDATIVASAILASCGKLYTEDMDDGQVVNDRLAIENPFCH